MRLLLPLTVTIQLISNPTVLFSLLVICVLLIQGQGFISSFYFFIHQHPCFPTIMAGGKYGSLVSSGMGWSLWTKAWPWLKAKADTCVPAFGSSFWDIWSPRQFCTDRNTVLRTEARSVLSFCFTAVSQHCCYVCDMLLGVCEKCQVHGLWGLLREMLYIREWNP